MTKVERDYCIKLMNEAIMKAHDAHGAYTSYQKLLKEGKTIDAECKLRQADAELGYAEGIRQALACIGFRHDSMKELDGLL